MPDAPAQPGPTAQNAARPARCVKCAYSLADLTSDTCPECGLDNGNGDAIVKTLYKPWVHRYAVALVVATFGLMILGGTVTSKGAALAVPDWPSTYGYNMFLFPPSLWQGNIFWEHTHRLYASGIGMMCIGLAIILIVTQQRRRWVWMMGLGLLALVCFQGLMGGLRVTELSIWLGVFHGIHGQLILCLTVLVAAATSRLWIERNWTAHTMGAPTQTSAPRAGILRRGALALLAIVLIQLVLGTGVRHHKAGLAIPDFPTAYGSYWPPMQQDQIEAAMIDYAGQSDRFEFMDRVFTPGQVMIHWTHRLWAAAVLGICLWMFGAIYRHAKDDPAVIIPAVALGVLLLSQLVLGVWVIWSGRHPELATAHQSIGAAFLAVSAWLTIRLYLPHPNSPTKITSTAESRSSGWSHSTTHLTAENTGA